MHMYMCIWNEVLILREKQFCFVGDISCSKDDDFFDHFFDDFFFDDSRYLWKCNWV